MTINSRSAFAELIGSAALLAVVIGSGIMAERLAGGNVAIALLANTLATVGGLYILIEVFAPISGAHLNPAVTLAVRQSRGRIWPNVQRQLRGNCALDDPQVQGWFDQLLSGQATGPGGPNNCRPIVPAVDEMPATWEAVIAWKDGSWGPAAH